VSAAGSGLVFDNTFDSTCSAAYDACVTAAELELSTLFTNSLTVSVSFHENNTGKGFQLTNGGEDSQIVSYAALKAALPSGDVLPASDPAPPGSTWKVTDSYGRMLGLTSAVGPSDSVTLNTYYNWTFGQDVINGLTHELSEGAMGRMGGLGGSTGTGDWRVMDLFHYTAEGVYDTTNGRDGQTTYFSSNGGPTTSWSVGLSFRNQYTTSGAFIAGDSDDWRQTAVFGGTSPGETLTLTQTELDVMAAIGWKVSLPQEIMTTSGNWETPTDWNDGFMPITPEDAFIGTLNNVTGRLTSAVTVNSIGTNAYSTLDISEGGDLTAANGTVLNPERTFTWASGNLGAIDVDVGSTLTIGNTYTNVGSTTVGQILSQAGGNGSMVLAGTVTLNGGGTLYLGQQSSTLQADSTGSITGAGSFLVTTGGLINTDNTIVGGGLINLSSFDNQASGVVDANQSEGNSLQIIASTFTNEGGIEAESRATLNLGKDGDTGSLTNTGTIALQSQSDLAIGGNYTIAGSGSIVFKGAGAEITSDGTAPATFANESTIKAGFSGQIGDAGVYGSNDLTFENIGTVVASGSGVTLALNTGIHTIDDAGGTLEAEDGATLAIDSNVDTGEIDVSLPPPSGGTIEAGSGGTVILSAAIARGISVFDTVPGQVVIDGGTFEMLAGSSVNVPIEFTAGGTLELFGIASVSVSGSNGAITAVAGDVVALTSGTGDTVTGTGFTVNASSGTGVTVGGNGEIGPLDVVSGSGVTVGVETNSHVAVTGSRDTVTMSTGAASVLVLNGATDAVSAASGDIVNLKSGTGDTITGTNITVDASSGTGVTVGGTGEFGPLDVVGGSGVTVGIETNSHVAVTGSSDTVTMSSGAASVLVLNGSTDAVSAASGDIVNLKSGTSDTITGTNVTVNASSGTGVTVGGNGEFGPLDVVSGSGVTVGTETNSHVAVTGSSDTVTMSSGAASVLVLNGSTDAVSAASGDIVNLKSGTSDTITGSGFTVNGSSEVGFKIVGTADIVYAGLNDSIADGGTGSLFKLTGSVGALTVSNFGSDTASGVFDLLGGIGGYASASAAYAALTSDGSGGSKLSFGAAGSLDIAGVAKSSLSAADFKIN
jgi:hypothetical protein